ncbi:MAG: imidazole glycerol phosphate synthase cyclase subunit, partial [Rhodospirillales bacterium]|nr:imidazole glycerol phosphate synthase cyclase subunit [Rhodospirillales bacterium]
MTVRIIPRLEIKGPNLVKGIHFEGLRVLGKPEAFARHYYEAGADELIYIDAVASLYGRNSLLHIVERTASEIFIPLTVGGGLRSLDDIREVLRAGADKVAINTAAIKDPDLIRQASRKFGSSTIVVLIEYIRHADGRYEAYTDFGRESSGVDALDWAQQAVELGAGELLVTSIDRDGT